ncbi:MAG: hypothetical protein KatS3mg011_0226 [Acidimicrobiia bacterium]|nr:MAG: hypothetical protein KatS3mg011_0226 [Acidimicrobiia bacterium]
MTPVAVALAYLVGAAPTWKVVEARWKVDLHHSGSGNPGAGNATRQAGLTAGVTLAALDGHKGLLPVLVARRIGLGELDQVAVGLAAVAGNDWPVWHRRRGGRGLATSVGVVLAAAPWVLVWPGLWALAGWRLGGGPAGFFGWALLPAFSLSVSAPTPTVALTSGLAALMIARRAEGNAGWSRRGLAERVFFDHDPRPPSETSRRSSLAWPVVLFGVGLPVYLGLTRATLGQVRVGPRGWVLLFGAVLAEFGAKLALGELFRSGAHRSGLDVSRSAALGAALVGTGVARLVPAGGAITPLAMAWAVGGDWRTAGAALRATVLSYGGLALGTGLALGWVTLRWAPGLGWTGWGLALGLCLLGGVLLLASARLRRLLPVVPPRFRDRVGSVLVDHHLDRRAAALVATRVLAESMALGLTLAAFEIALKPSQVVASFGVSQLVGGLPGTPGGVLYTEVGLLGALGVFGVPAAVGMGPVLVFRLVSYWLPAMAGAAAGGAAFLSRRG